MQNLTNQTQQSTPRLKVFLTSWLVKIVAISAISASTCYAFYNFNYNGSTPTAMSSTDYNRVINQKYMTVVASQNPSAYFKDGDNIMHGFGYDLTRLYANELDVELKFETVADDETALEWVKLGKADFAITTANEKQLTAHKLNAISLACGDIHSLSQNGLDEQLQWTFKSQQETLTQKAQQFACDHKQNGTMQQLASFYSRYIVNDDDWFFVKRDLNDRLPMYKADFKANAKQYDLDWHLLAAMGYQESLLKADSVSPTGVKGLMMLTNSTAKEMGIENREDPLQSIQGGAKYFDRLLDSYNHVPNPDRTWFALVAYNMGPGAVKRIQNEIEAQGKNPNDFVNLFDYLQRNSAENSRYVQAIHYVTRVRTFLEHLKEEQLPRV